MRRFAVFSLVLLTAVLLQTTFFARYVTLFGITPDLILVVVISFSILEGPTVGATTGFGGGLLRDLLVAAPKGLTGLAYLIVGYAIGIGRPYVQSTSVLVPVIGVFVGSLAGSALYVILTALLGEPVFSLARIGRVVLLTAIYNTLLVPFVYPVVRKIASVYKAEKVYKW